MDLQKLEKQLILHEEVKLKPYIDTVGKLTIGVGHNLSDNGISIDTAMFVLNEDINEVLADLNTFTWFQHLDEIRQRVLADMRFNLGPHGFRTFTGLLHAVERGEYAKAAEEMLHSLWAVQTKTRALRLANMMLSGRDYLG